MSDSVRNRLFGADTRLLSGGVGAYGLPDSNADQMRRPYPGCFLFTNVSGVFFKNEINTEAKR